jgi:hypothetical protein
MTSLGSLDFSFSADWDHAQMAVTTRPTPGQPGSYDVVFNVGSQFNDTLSTGTVSVAGLATATLNPDSLYMVRVTVNGSQATVSNPQQIASGIRNVIGMGFDAGTGDFYFADNAIDGPPGQGNDTDPTPPQADELNVIRAADIGTSVVNFGFPDCYIQYKTGAAVGSGCVQPLVAFQPINGSPTQGPTQMVFAPADFPVGFNHGVFVSFAGEPGSGTQNDDDGVVYYSFDTGQYLQFIAPAQAAIGKPLGLLATSDTLYLADYNYGSIEAITPSAPEPGTMAMGFGLFGLGAAAMRFRRSAGQAIRKGCV